jgi:hypothetical protein
MGMAQHSHRDSIYAARGMAWRGGLDKTVPALTVARNLRQRRRGGRGRRRADPRRPCATIHARPFVVVGGAESMQYPFSLYGVRGKKLGAAVQKYGPNRRQGPAGRHPPPGHAAHEPVRPVGGDGDGQHRRGAGPALPHHPRGGRRLRLPVADPGQGRRATPGAFREETVPVSVQLDGASPPARGRPRHPHPRRRVPGQDGATAGGLRGRRHRHRRQRPARWSTARGAMVIGTAADAAKHGARPLARLAGVGVAGCDPKIHGLGAGAGHRARAGGRRHHRQGHRAGSSSTRPSRPRPWRSSAILAAQGIDPRDRQPRGAARSPSGIRSAPPARILTLTCAYGLRRAKQRYGLVTMCIGGGQGISLVIEAL